ncbi:hypothetical protein [Cytobacillus kochii]|nr:hypothetical protein [Cytobacillus kochii]
MSASQMRFVSHLRTKEATRTKTAANNKPNFTQPSSLISFARFYLF